MYTSFYKLDRKPFEMFPDPYFLWLGDKHKEALSTLRYGILENKGFLLLTGESGVGKTTLINTLTKNFENDVEWAVIKDPSLERIDFYNAIATGFGLEKQFTSKVQFLIQFSHFLHKADDEKKKVVLLVDDCHRLSQEMLEELRLLSNIEKSDAKLINIFFIGEPVFNEMLVQQKNRAVRQRLTLKSELQPFTANETDDYIRHRLNVAGSEDKIFSAKAIQTIHSYAQGIPRRINTICEHALTEGGSRGLESIDHRLIEECVQKLNLPSQGETEFEEEASPQASPEPPASVKIPQEEKSQRPDSALAGLSIGENKKGGWLKYGLGAAAVLAAAIFFLYPADKDVEIAKDVKETSQKEVAVVEAPAPSTTTSPAVAVLEESKDEINQEKAAELKSAILEKAYSEGEQKPEVVKAEETAVDSVADMKPEIQEATPTPKIVEKVVSDVEKTSQALEEIPEKIVITETGETNVEKVGVEKAEVAPAVGQPVDTTPTPPAEVVEKQVEAVDQTKATITVAEARKSANQELVEQKVEETATIAAVASSESEVKLEAIDEGVAKVEPTATALPPLEPKKVILGLLPNSLKLTKAGGREFDSFLEKLQQYPRATILVKGFVSAKTNSAENIKLSEDRAQGVYKLLLKNGIDEEQIEVKGMGNQEPIASNDTRAGRAKNRRVEIIVINDGT